MTRVSTPRASISGFSRSAAAAAGAHPPLRRRGGVEADELPPRRLQRRLDAVKTVDAGDVGVALAPRLKLRRRARRLCWGGGAALLSLDVRRAPAPVAIAGHRERPLRLDIW